MVFVKQEAKKLERTKAVGKLVGITTDPEGVKDSAKGLFVYLDLSVVQEVEGKDSVWLNVRCWRKGETYISLEALQELKKADDLLKQKKRPFVQIQYYTSKKVGKNKDGEDVIYTNLGASVDDVREGFRVLRDDATLPDERVMEEKIG